MRVEAEDKGSDVAEFDGNPEIRTTMNVRNIRPPKYLLRLSSVINEQHLICGSEAAILEESYRRINPQWVKVSSLKSARDIARRFRDDNGLGAGNWVGGQIFDKTGAKIGRFSYNCRFWRREHPFETESNKIKHAPSALLNELH